MELDVFFPPSRDLGAGSGRYFAFSFSLGVGSLLFSSFLVREGWVCPSLNLWHGLVPPRERNICGSSHSPAELSRRCPLRHSVQHLSPQSSVPQLDSIACSFSVSALTIRVSLHIASKESTRGGQGRQAHACPTRKSSNYQDNNRLQACLRNFCTMAAGQQFSALRQIRIGLRSLHARPCCTAPAASISPGTATTRGISYTNSPLVIHLENAFFLTAPVFHLYVMTGSSEQSR